MTTKRWRVTFIKNTGVQVDSCLEISSLEIDAETKGNAVRTALEAIKVASVRDPWDSISVSLLGDIK